MKTSIMTFLILFFLAISGVSCAQKEKSQAAKVTGEKTAQEVVSLITPEALNEANQGIQLIDIRTPDEFATGHIENSVNINFFDEDFDQQLNKLNKDKEVFIYCRSGGRSAKAAERMEALGFSRVYDLEGGILNWQKKNLKVVH